MKHRVRNILEIRDKLSGLPDLAESEKTVTSRDAVGLLWDVLDGLISKGYSVDTIAHLLKENGMEISLSTLRRYMRQPAPGKGKRRGARKSQTKSGEEIQPADVVSPEGPATATSAATQRATGGFQIRKDSDEL